MKEAKINLLMSLQNKVDTIYSLNGAYSNSVTNKYIANKE